MKLVLPELDGSAIIEKYHVIKQTKGLLLLPLGSVGSPRISKVVKTTKYPAGTEMCCEFGMKIANAIDLALLEQYNMGQGSWKKSLCLELAYFSLNWVFST